ncbi:amino acid adenylation domain-containing protein [Acidovorax sp. SUPP3434]|uniref:non-ribosomal peptide synthetase n=1 Tax=Acidovorax sp. SUPP3434 TaxID=2920880 RepID=UPI0023DE413B|nr:non-ribosomal peptide synthetase [Acidovorax sp. SUPP3434]GKT02227.1 amino acid adenylation domain-containing protein [Acidovorax sp. SUPP3434]
MTAPQDIQSLRARLSPEQRAQLDARLRGGGRAAPRGGQDIPRRDPATPALLSHAQRSLWLTWQLAPESPAYNLAGSLEMDGPLNASALSAALGDLVARHDILRTLITIGGDGQALQAVQPQAGVPLQLPVVDLREQARIEDALADALADFAQTPFALDREVPLRACLYRLGEQHHVLALSMHHIAADGWSLRILVDELLQCYAARLGARPHALAPLPIQFTDYAAWERQRLDGGERERQLRYWRDRLGSAHEPLELPLSHVRGAVTDAAEGRHRFVWPIELSDAVRAMARARGASLFMVMTALLDLLLYRLSGQRRIRVGTPIANRGKAETHGLIGYLLNLQVVQVDVAPQMGFGELLEQVRHAVLDAQQHADLPFDMLVEALAPERQPGVHPLFQVKCTQQDAMERERSVAGLHVRMQAMTAGHAHFDLSLDFTDRAEGIESVFIYDTGLFDAQRIAVFAEGLTRCAQQVVMAPDRALAALALTDPAEGLQMVAVPQPASPQATTVLSLWDAAVASQGQGLAVRAESRTASFGHLDKAANQLAARLRTQGLGPETRVGVLAPRSPEMVLGMLAVLKAGCVHVPLDPELPADRLAYQLHDSGARLVLALQPPSWQPGIPVWPLALSEPADLDADALETATLHRDQAAYLIYTSGSTGQPKGVVITHGALANYVQGVLARLDLPVDASSMAMVSTVAADLGHTVLFGALCSGRLLHLMSPERAFDPDAFADYMHTHQVDVLKIVPSHLQALLSAARPEQVLPRHRLVLGGEATGWPLYAQIAALSPLTRVLNHYGPTETTVGVLTQEADAAVREAGTVPLGLPLRNSCAHVLDEWLSPVPQGLAGELYLGGAGLARGYEGRPGQTCERFVADPWCAGQRLYRTGDRVRQLKDGSIEFLGRNDDQIKLHGYRVELSEVAQALRKLPGVASAEAIVREAENGQQRLLAYVVAQERQVIDVAALRESLARTLPPYMLPAAIVVLPRLPLTMNGKVDRHALPEPETAECGGHEAPVGPTEQTLAAVWSEVLGREPVSRRDNFFEIGGDSILALKVVAKARKHGLKLVPKQLFEQVSLQQLAEMLQAPPVAGQSTVACPVQDQDQAIPVLAPELRNKPLVPSHAQLRQWFLWQLDPHSSAYHIAGALKLAGELDLDALRMSFDELVARHESLRTVFSADEQGQVWQQVQAPAELPGAAMPLIDFSALPEDQRDAAVQRQALDTIATPFNLSRGPLLRLALIRAAQHMHVLVVVMHHIVSDGWSMQIIVEEFAQRYRARLAGQRLTLPALRLQYADYAAWHKGWLEAGEGPRQLAYWRDRLGNEHPVMQLPASRPRRADGRYRAAQHAITLSADRVRGLQRRAQAQGMSLFMVLLAGFQALLHRYTGLQDIRVGVPTANRHRAESQGIVGFFVNTQVMRGQLHGQLTLSELLAQARDAVAQAQAHQDLPFEQLVEALHPQRSLSVSPLFQVMFNHQRKGHQVLEQLPGLRFEGYLDIERSTIFEFMLDTVEWEDGRLSAQFSYAQELFDAPMVERLAGSFDQILAALVETPGARLSEIGILGATEIRKLDAWSRAGEHGAGPASLVEMIENQVELQPQAVAIECAGQSLSYGELNLRANRLAHLLLERGIGPERRVAVALERGVDSVVALLAILKAGAAYVPLDLEYPADRIAVMLEDSRADAFIHHADAGAALSGVFGGLVAIDLRRVAWEHLSGSNPTVALNADGLLYILFTSGSTGRPKGIAMRQGVLSQLAAWQIDRMPGAARTLMFASPCFDVGYQEVVVALCSGATLVQTDAAQRRDFFLLLALMEERAVERVYLPYAVLQLLAEAALRLDRNLPALRQIITAGEQLKLTEELRAWLQRMPRCRLVNQYGPTETHVVSSFDVDAGDGRTLPPIGSPASTAILRVLDTALQPVSPGVVGELYLGGALARGYVGRPALTAQRFVADPLGPHAGRLYRTGDLARWDEYGQLEYLGRVDHQVKIRGFRVEVGEVEVALLALEPVREAVVVAQELAGTSRLVAYVVGQPGAAVDTGALREGLRLSLPDYMLPSAFVELQALPLNANGKVDRVRLPDPAGGSSRAHEEPSGDTEQGLARIWREVLSVERVGRGDNFFELGGHSLLAAQMVARVQSAMQTGLAVKDVFEAPELSAMAARIATSGDQRAKLREMASFVDSLENV